MCASRGPAWSCPNVRLLANLSWQIRQCLARMCVRPTPFSSAETERDWRKRPRGRPGDVGSRPRPGTRGFHDLQQRASSSARLRPRPAESSGQVRRGGGHLRPAQDTACSAASASRPAVLGSNRRRPLPAREPEPREEDERLCYPGIPGDAELCFWEEISLSSSPWDGPAPPPTATPSIGGPGIRRWPTQARFDPGEAGSERRLRQTST